MAQTDATRFKEEKLNRDQSTEWRFFDNGERESNRFPLPFQRVSTSPYIHEFALAVVAIRPLLQPNNV